MSTELLRHKTKILLLIVIIAAISISLSNTANALIITPSNFSLEGNHNSVISGHFRVIPENLSQDIYIYESSIFDIVFSETVIFNLSTYKDIDFNISIPETFKSGLYVIDFFAFGDNETKNSKLEILVKSDSDFEVIDNVDINTTSGNSSFFLLDIKNIGNEMLKLDFSIDNENYIRNINTYDDIIIYPNITVQVPITYKLDNSITNGIYYSNVTLTDVLTNNVSRLIEFSFYVQDDIFPNIEVIEYDTNVLAGYYFPVSVIVSDNIAVANVTIEFNDSENLNITKTLILSEDNGKYSSSLLFKALGKQQFKIIVEDINSNIISLDREVNLSQMKSLVIYDFPYYQIEVDNLFTYDIAKTNFSVPVSIKFKNSEFITRRSLKGENGSSNKDLYILYYYVDDVRYEFNSTLNVTEFQAKHIKFGFKTNSLGEFQTDMILSFPDWVSDNITIPILFKIGTSDIKERHVVNTGSKQSICNINKVNGVILGWDCSTFYNINEDISTVRNCFTDSEYLKLEHAYNATIERVKIDGDIAATWGVVYLIIVIILLIFMLIYYITIIKGFHVFRNM